MPVDGRGMSFHHGNIKLDSSTETFRMSSAPESTSGKQQHFYIFSDVGIGRPYLIDQDKRADESYRVKPEGYDSLYLSKAQIDKDGDGFISAEEYDAATQEKDPALYEHEYIVTDPSQVLPRYVVRFAADVESEAESSGDKNDPLKVYDRYDFFDPVLYKPVSLRDKMVGSHSMGEAATHKLVNLGDAYNAAISEAKKSDPVVQAKRLGIMEELNKIDTKLRAINMNFAQVEEDLYGILKKSLTKLKDEVSCKTKVLLSTELEFRRQLEQFDNAEQWLVREQEDLSQTDFLQAWKQHTSMTAKMCSSISSETSILYNLKANLTIDGCVDIVTTSGEALMSVNGGGLGPVGRDSGGGGGG